MTGARQEARMLEASAAELRNPFTIAADLAFTQAHIDLIERHEAKMAATFARIDAMRNREAQP